MARYVSVCKNSFLRIRRKSLSLGKLGATLLLLAIGPSGMAATINVADGDNLYGVVPAANDTWLLNGSAFLYSPVGTSYAKVLPGALTIAGASGGSMVTLNNGSGRYGYFMPQASSTLDMTLSDLTVTGSSAMSALYNNGGGVTLDLDGVTFSGNNGVNGGAIYATGNIVVNGGATFTGNSSGSSSGYGGAVFTLTNLTIAAVGQTVTVSNNAAPSTAASSGGGGGLNAGGSITIPGSALFDQNLAAGSNGGAIRSVGGAISVGTAAGSSVTVTGNRVSAANANGGGFFAGTGGSITIGNSTGTVLLGGSGMAGNSAANGGGLYSAGDVNVSGNAIGVVYNKTTSGHGAGIYAAGNLTLNAAGPAMISDNVAAGAMGGGFWVGGNFTLNAADEVAFEHNKAGSKANGVYLNNTGSGKTATLNASAGAAILFYDPLESSAANGLVGVVSSGAGRVSFDGSQAGSAADRWSQVYASTRVNAGTFEVANDARYGVRAATVGAPTDSVFMTAAGTVLQGGVAGTVDADQITLGGDLNLAGDQPAVRGTFTFNGKNAVFSNGQLQFNTELNDGSVQNTDLLIFNGASTSGSAAVQITNVGGLGAATVGNGIQVIQINGAATNAATFTLASPVYAGIYQYFLVKVGSHWYLQSRPMPALQLSKSASPPVFTPGSTVTYTVTATNTSVGSAIGNITIADPLPAGIDSFAWTCTGNGATCPNAAGSGALNETLVTLPAGASVTYTVTAVVSASPPVRIDNTATASATGMLCAPGNTSPPCSASAPLPAVPVVRITKTANTALLVPGDAVVYTVTAANVGAIAATSVVIGDAVPAGIDSFAWTCTGSGAACPNAAGSGALNETLATLPAGASVTYTVTAMVSALPPARIDNTATASAAGMLCAPGNTPSPCSASAPLPATPVVQLRKTTSATAIVAGSSITYTVTLSNTSASAAGNVVIADPLPAGIDSFAWTCTGNGATCPNAAGSGALNETLATLPAGASVTYTVTAVVSASPPTRIDNTATASATGMLCAPGNTPSPCSASAPLPAAPVVQISKTAGVMVAVPGDAVTYTVTVANTGSVAATAVVVSDAIPPGIASFAWTCTGSGAACPNAVGSGALNETLATLPAGASVTYTVSAPAATASPPAQIDNAATASATGMLCAPGNTPSPCSASALLPVSPVIQLSKTVNVARAMPGDTVTYTVTVTHAGGAAANNVIVSDLPPAGIVSFNWTCTGSGAVCPNAAGSGPLNETIATLPVGASVVYTLDALISNNPPAQIDNTATALSAGMLCAPGNALSPCNSGQVLLQVTLPVTAIPVSGRWGLALLAGLLLGFGWRRRAMLMK